MDCPTNQFRLTPPPIEKEKKMIDPTDVMPAQGETADGHEFGYIPAGGGGFFFTWRYGADMTPGSPKPGEGAADPGGDQP